MFIRCISCGEKQVTSVGVIDFPDDRHCEACFDRIEKGRIEYEDSADYREREVYDELDSSFNEPHPYY